MNIFALDAATKCGWAALYDGKQQSGVIDFTSYAKQEPRLFSEFYHWLHGALGMFDALILERNYLSFRGSSARLAGLNALARMAAYEQQSEIHEVAPAQWRKIVFGAGKANLKRADAKREAKLHAAKLGYPNRDDNEADAICLIDWFNRKDALPKVA